MNFHHKSNSSTIPILIAPMHSVTHPIEYLNLQITGRDRTRTDLMGSQIWNSSKMEKIVEKRRENSVTHQSSRYFLFPRNGHKTDIKIWEQVEYCIGDP